MKKREFILNVKRTTFYVYLYSLITGLAFILASIILYLLNKNSFIYTLCCGLGSGIIPTSLISFFIDRSNQIKITSKKNDIRDNFRLPVVNSFTMSLFKVVHLFYKNEYSCDKSFNDLIGDSLEIVRKKYGSSSDFVEEVNIRKTLLERISSELLTCSKNCNDIIDHEFALRLNDIFSQYEIRVFEYIKNDCNEILSLAVMSDIAERLEVLIDLFKSSFFEYDKKLQNIMVLEKGRIKNKTDFILK